MTETPIPANFQEVVREHVKRYLESDGKDGHMWDSSIAGGPGPVPTLLLTTTGRKSGTAITLPLIYGKTGKDFVIVASKGGAPAHPAWYLNLSSNPLNTLPSLDALDDLEELILDNNPIEDLSFISGMNSLALLSAKYCLLAELPNVERDRKPHQRQFVQQLSE